MLAAVFKHSWIPPISDNLLLLERAALEGELTGMQILFKSFSQECEILEKMEGEF